MTEWTVEEATAVGRMLETMWTETLPKAADRWARKDARFALAETTVSVGAHLLKATARDAHENDEVGHERPAAHTVWGRGLLTLCVRANMPCSCCTRSCVS